MTIQRTNLDELKLTQPIITDIQYDLGSDLLGFIGTISLLRPKNEYSATAMHLNIDIFSDLTCEKRINNTTISTKNDKDREYFQVFKSNNDTYKWVNATDDAVKNGFGKEFAKRPVVFLLGKWLKNNNKATFTSETKYYIVYTWENIDKDGNSISDINSIIWPNFESY